MFEVNFVVSSIYNVQYMEFIVAYNTLKWQQFDIR
jgi:hypothetical protein